MSTRAITYLKKKGVPFDVVTYDHGQKGAEFAANATGFPLARTIKTLVVDLGEKNYAMVLMPGDKQLGLKRLADALAVKRAALADQASAERLTGYLTGGISPFGTTRRLPVVMEKVLVTYDRVLINAGRRGTMLKMDPGDIVHALDCQVLDVGDQ
jgi:Cys-tRNA(Pro)/Cys-tRNA(Cys) deacylase